jgi:hypothetical protein
MLFVARRDRIARDVGLVDAIIKADEQAEEAGFRISWLRPLAREAHGIARRNSR